MNTLPTEYTPGSLSAPNNQHIVDPHCERAVGNSLCAAQAHAPNIPNRSSREPAAPTHHARRALGVGRHVWWANPLEHIITPSRTRAGILRITIRYSPTSPEPLTPSFTVELEFRRARYDVPFPPVKNSGSVLARFEQRIVSSVGTDQQDAIREALQTGYQLQGGYWGRTITRRSRGPAVAFPEAAFHAFRNCIRHDAVVQLVHACRCLFQLHVRAHLNGLH
jgi:hypothetical protein